MNETSQPSSRTESEARVHARAPSHESAAPGAERGAVDAQAPGDGSRGGGRYGSESEFGPSTSLASRSVHIDLNRLERAGILSPRLLNSRLAEELRIVKRRLLLNAAGLTEQPIIDGNLILVTSAGPGDGKTYMSTNLAMSIAMEVDRTVLLVDCDTGRSGATRLFGLSEKVGLSDLLQRSDLEVSDVLLQTDIPNLRIIPAGMRIGHINELMASAKMASLIRDLATRYSERVIILDGPPLLATSEASLLARLAGQIVFVVAAGKTSRGDVLNALDHLNGAPPISLILNRSTQRVETASHESYWG
ncbi:MAG: AAA family ATPase [Methylotetracoccus sp.]